MSHTRDEYLYILKEHPVRIANLVGFTKLGELHNEWMKKILYGKGDDTILAHRLSYKTTTISFTQSIIIAFRPRATTLFLRKTDTDVKEIVAQVIKILQNPAFQYIVEQVMGQPLELTKCTSTEINTSLTDTVRGTSQYLGMGIGGSLTGKHYDYIFTDDIVNIEDRKSKAERERTKTVYDELQNIKNKGGRIINTGTPWHKEDAIATRMPNIEMWDCYHTGIMTEAEIEDKRMSMSPSLFAANYELRHIAVENALFMTQPVYTEDESMLRDGIAHIDAAYGGEDYTAFTCGKRVGDTLYLYGRIWHRHVDVVLDTITAEAQRLMCAPIWCEDNGDKGFLANEIRKQYGMKAVTYHESENKYIKISSYLRKWWGNIVWLKGTDRDYINQIMDYTEDAEHDDAPDSASVVCRYWDKRRGNSYQSVFG